MAKNDILIVEFANQPRHAGHGIREAVVEHSVVRLRPIIMTVVSAALVVPLLIQVSQCDSSFVGWMLRSPPIAPV